MCKYYSTFLAVWFVSLLTNPASTILKIPCCTPTYTQVCVHKFVYMQICIPTWQDEKNHLSKMKKLFQISTFLFHFLKIVWTFLTSNMVCNVLQSVKIFITHPATVFSHKIFTFIDMMIFISKIVMKCHLDWWNQTLWLLNSKDFSGNWD